MTKATAAKKKAAKKPAAKKKASKPKIVGAPADRPITPRGFRDTEHPRGSMLPLYARDPETGDLASTGQRCYFNESRGQARFDSAFGGRFVKSPAHLEEILGGEGLEDIKKIVVLGADLPEEEPFEVGAEGPPIHSDGAPDEYPAEQEG